MRLQECYESCSKHMCVRQGRYEHLVLVSIADQSALQALYHHCEAPHLLFLEGQLLTRNVQLALQVR